MTKIKNGTLKKTLFLLIIIEFMFLALEGSMRLISFVKSGKSGNMPRYDITICTGGGDRISEKKAPIKLGLDPFTVYRHMPGQGTENFSINNAGMRGVFPDTSAAETLAIVIGGSAAFGWSAEADTETFEYMLAGLDTGLAVLNAGIAGYLSGQELGLTVHSLIDYSPDIIIAYDGWNDLFIQWFGRKRSPGRYGFSESYFDIEKKLVDNYKRESGIIWASAGLIKAILDKSIIYKRIKTAVEASGIKKENKRNLAGKDGSYFDAITAAYCSNIKKMDDICRSRGIRFIVALQPELGRKVFKTGAENKVYSEGMLKGKLYGEVFPGLYGVFTKKASAFMMENNIEHIDINANPLITSSREDLFTDCVHTNAAGNAVIAGILSLKIKEGSATPAEKLPPGRP